MRTKAAAPAAALATEQGAQADGAEYRGPVRMCVICRRRLPKAQLTRLVLAAQGQLEVDEKKTRPGRGWYLCSDPVCAKKFARYRPGTRRAAVKLKKSRTDGDIAKGGNHV